MWPHPSLQELLRRWTEGEVGEEKGLGGAALNGRKSLRCFLYSATTQDPAKVLREDNV